MVVDAMQFNSIQCIYCPLQLVLFPTESKTADITLTHAEILLMETQ